MLMLSHDNWDKLDPKWNVDGVLPWQLTHLIITLITGLGWNENMSNKKLDSAFVLHWSGRSEFMII